MHNDMTINSPRASIEHTTSLAPFLSLSLSISRFLYSLPKAQASLTLLAECLFEGWNAVKVSRVELFNIEYDDNRFGNPCSVVIKSEMGRAMIRKYN